MLFCCLFFVEEVFSGGGGTVGRTGGPMAEGLPVRIPVPTVYIIRNKVNFKSQRRMVAVMLQKTPFFPLRQDLVFDFFFVLFLISFEISRWAGKAEPEPARMQVTVIYGQSVGPIVHTWLSHRWPTSTSYYPSAVHGAGGAGAHQPPQTLPVCNLLVELFT